MSKRDIEYIDDNKVKIDEYNEKDRYTEYESIEEYKKQLAKENKNFSIGKPLIFDVENALLEYPIKLNKKGEKVTTQDEYGNTLYVKDEDKKPFVKFTKRGIGRKAICNIQLNVFIDMLEDLQAQLYATDKAKAEKVKDLLDTVFPKDKINFGTFEEDGDRDIKEDKFFYLCKSNLVLRAFPMLDEDGQPIVNSFMWVDDKGQHSIDLCYYKNTPIDGAQLGIK